MTSPIISASALKTIQHSRNLILFDVRVGKDAKEKYLKKHIKGARFADLEKDLAEVPENAAFGGRHPLPDIENFRKTLENFGVNEDAHIVVYDDKSGANAAARLWWMLRAFGLNVQLLDGGFQAAEKKIWNFLPEKNFLKKANWNHAANGCFPPQLWKKWNPELQTELQWLSMFGMPTAIVENPNLLIWLQDIFPEP